MTSPNTHFYQPTSNNLANLYHLPSTPSTGSLYIPSYSLHPHTPASAIQSVFQLGKCSFLHFKFCFLRKKKCPSENAPVSFPTEFSLWRFCLRCPILLGDTSSTYCKKQSKRTHLLNIKKEKKITDHLLFWIMTVLYVFQLEWFWRNSYISFRLYFIYHICCLLALENTCISALVLNYQVVWENIYILRENIYILWETQMGAGPAWRMGKKSIPHPSANPREAGHHGPRKYWNILSCLQYHCFKSFLCSSLPPKLNGPIYYWLFNVMSWAALHNTKCSHGPSDNVSPLFISRNLSRGA